MKRWSELAGTALYAGYCPVAPGTAGTLVGMAVYVAEYLLFGDISWLVNILVLLVLFYPAIKICGDGIEIFGKEDPQQIVLDEVMGYWTAVAFFDFSWTVAVSAFFLFRFFDILKPFPVNRMEEIGGGAGILLDDMAAGIYSALVIAAAGAVFSVFS